MKNRSSYCRIAVLLAFVMTAVFVAPVSAASRPAKVTGVKALSADDVSVGLSWSKAAGAKSYEVQYRPASSKSWSSKKASSRKITIKGLKSGTAYKFRVRGLKGSKKGAWSNVLSQKTYVRPAVVDNKTIFALEQNTGQIRLRWRASEGATGYRIRTWQPNRWPDLDEQDADYKEIGENKFEVLPEFTTRVALRPNTWYGFNVRAVNYDTGKFTALMSDWSRAFYACTTTEGRLITGKEEIIYGETIHAYELNDIFVAGADEQLIPLGVYEHTDYSGEDPVDTFYLTDYMAVQGISFPESFERLDDTNIDVDFAGKTYKIGDDLDGHSIKSITLSPHTGDSGMTGDFDVTFGLSDAESVTLTW
ncbi:MAG: fibronectin type III domain-containing protein [Eubacterium sp.]|nr:fibronectin type III domain-containing protein [Eubacterium sp.]